MSLFGVRRTTLTRTTTTTRYPDRHDHLVAVRLSSQVATRTSQDDEDSLLLYGTATIDYSAANEYVEEHYHPNREEQPYFQRHHYNQEQPVAVVVQEPIYNARQGFITNMQQNKQDATKRILTASPSLETCGFCLLKEDADDNCDDPLSIDDDDDQSSLDWYNVQSIERYYLPRLRQKLETVLLPQSSNGTTDRSTNNTFIRHVLFWNPMVRRRDFLQTRQQSSQQQQQQQQSQQSTPTASYAALPHIDTDVGAFQDPSALVHFLYKNAIGMDMDDTTTKDKMIRDLESGYRFCILNVWKNIGSEPVQTAPLGLFAAQYTSSDNENEHDDATNSVQVFPDAAPCPEMSRWYVYPNMTSSELLLFCQYDRDASRPSDLWHCALTNLNTTTTTTIINNNSTRSSFDIRCFAILNERLDDDDDDKFLQQRDRFRVNRTRPGLTLLESSEFCSRQSTARRVSAGSNSGGQQR